MPNLVHPKQFGAVYSRFSVNNTNFTNLIEEGERPGTVEPSDFFSWFFFFDIGGEELDSTLLYKDEIPERTRSRLESNLASREKNFGRALAIGSGLGGTHFSQSLPSKLFLNSLNICYVYLRSNQVTAIAHSDQSIEKNPQRTTHSDSYRPAHSGRLASTRPQ